MDEVKIVTILCLIKVLKKTNIFIRNHTQKNYFLYDGH